MHDVRSLTFTSLGGRVVADPRECWPQLVELQCLPSLESLAAVAHVLSADNLWRHEYAILGTGLRRRRGGGVWLLEQQRFRGRIGQRNGQRAPRSTSGRGRGRGVRGGRRCGGQKLQRWNRPHGNLSVLYFCASSNHPPRTRTSRTRTCCSSLSRTRTGTSPAGTYDVVPATNSSATVTSGLAPPS